MTTGKTSLLLGTACLLLSACPLDDAQWPDPADLAPDWQVDKLRILGIQADPPEIRPGETATFRALIADPRAASGAVVWIACPESEGGDFGCGLSGDFDFTDATPEELAEQGFIGFEPFLQPRYVAAPDSLDGLTTFEALDGIYVTVQLAILPQSVLDGGFGGDFDFNEVEVGYKRLVVSSVDEPNANPEIARFSVDGVTVPPGAVVEIDRGESYELGIDLVPGADETYLYTNKDGVTEERHEEPYVAWFSTGGTVREPVTLFGYFSSTWRAPSAVNATSEGTWYAVVRDRRGGMAWTTQRWRVRP